jgi:tight adherence protein C
MLEALTVFVGFAAVFLVVTGLRTRPADPVADRLRTVQAGMGSRNRTMAQPFIRRAAIPMAGALARLVMKLVPTTWLKDIEQRLIWAGGKMTLPGYVLLTFLTTPTFGFLSWVISGTFGVAGIVHVIIAGVGVAIGVYLPRFALNSRISQRAYLTRKSLPDALDLMTTSVEAGLSLDAALVRVGEYVQGPFQEELSLALQDMTLGKSRKVALEEIMQRLNVPEVASFIQAVNQAEVTGAPIGQVLRTQADTVRIRRRQAAEAQAQRAPILMLIPLIFFILPSLFVVILAPAAMTIIDLLSNSSLTSR